MKWYGSRSWMYASRSQEGPTSVLRIMGVVADGLVLAHHDDPSVGGPKDLYWGAIETAERLRSDHLTRGAGDRLSLGDVDHLVDVRKDRVDVVSDQQHGHPALAADALDQTGDRLLVVEVEAVKGLVQHQHPGAGDQGLGDQDALLLAPRKLSDRTVRVCLGPDHLDDGVDPPCLGGGSGHEPGQERHWHPPACAVEAQAHQVDGSDAQVGIEVAPLGQVTDGVVAAPNRLPEDGDGAFGDRQDAQYRLQQG